MARTPSLGLALYPTQPPQDLRRLAHLAEELGYANLWFGDSQSIWRDAYVTMAAAAVGTERVVFGSAVSNTVTRHVSVLASAWVTMHELTGGRVAAGLGTGFTSVRTLGLGPTRLADLEQAIDELRTLWSGGTVAHHESGQRYALSYVGDGVSIPVYVAASGPRLLQLAGRIADGVIVLVGTDPGSVRSALERVEAGARERGRRLEDLHVVLWAPGAVGPDAAKARDLVRPHVASTLMQALRVDLPPAEREIVERIRAAYDDYDHMVVGSPHARLVTDALVDRFALAGSPEHCAERIRALAAVGVDQVAIIPFAPPGQDRSATVEGFAAVERGAAG